jgi:H+/Cl- antiporter ClcA
LLLACVAFIRTDEFLGLGVPTIVRALTDPTLPAYAFVAKLVLTTITIGSGFIGGEVTPLFFMGATAGNVFGRELGIPIGLAAAVGLVAALATASRAPIALTVMAFELFGLEVLPHAAIVCALCHALQHLSSRMRTGSV